MKKHIFVTVLNHESHKGASCALRLSPCNFIYHQVRYSRIFIKSEWSEHQIKRKVYKNFFIKLFKTNKQIQCKYLYILIYYNKTSFKRLCLSHFGNLIRLES